MDLSDYSHGVSGNRMVTLQEDEEELEKPVFGDLDEEVAALVGKGGVDGAGNAAVGNEKLEKLREALTATADDGGDDIDDIGDADPSFDGLLNFSGTVLIAEYLCQRICVPRDMGAPAAAAIRNFAEELAQCARRSSLRSKGDG